MPITDLIACDLSGCNRSDREPYPPGWLSIETPAGAVLGEYGRYSPFAEPRTYCTPDHAIIDLIRRLPLRDPHRLHAELRRAAGNPDPTSLTLPEGS